MKFVKSNYRKKGLILLLLSFGMIFANVGFSSLNFPLNFTSINEETNLENDFDYKEQPPKTAEYQNFDGLGENINITLHQSHLNTSLIEFANLDNDNSFSQPCPIDLTFNSSYVNMSIEDIKAQDKELIIETGTTNTVAIPSSPTFRYAFSFKVRGNSYFKNLV